MKTGGPHRKWLSLIALVVAGTLHCARHAPAPAVGGAARPASNAGAIPPSRDLPSDSATARPPAKPVPEISETAVTPAARSSGGASTPEGTSPAAGGAAGAVAGSPSPPRPASPAAAAYVFAPNQTVSGASGPAASNVASARDVSTARLPNPASGQSAPASAAPAPPDEAGRPAAATRDPGDAAASSGQVQLAAVASPAELTVGSTVTVDIIASSGAPVVDTPFHLQFDPGVLAYVDASPGEFLAQAGSSVVFLADGQSRPGDIAIGIGRVDRTAGATGVGLLCRIHLRGLALGGTTVSFGQALAWDASDRSVAVVTLGSSVVVLGQSSPAR